MHTVTAQLQEKGGGRHESWVLQMVVYFCCHLIVILQMDNKGLGICTESSGTLLRGQLFRMMLDQITITH